MRWGYLLLGSTLSENKKQVQLLEKTLLELAFLIVFADRKLRTEESQKAAKGSTKAVCKHQYIFISFKFQGLNGVDKIIDKI